jgi:pilus assembly protein CpaF
MGLLDRVRERETGKGPERPAEPHTSSAPAQATPPPTKSPETTPPADSGKRRGLTSGSSASSGAARKQNAANEIVSELKIRIHAELIDRLDLAALGRLSPEQAGEEIRGVIAQLLEADGMPLSREDRKRLEAEITSEVLGYGPLDALLKDDSVNDILVNGPKQVYVERRGNLELTHCQFRDDEHLVQIIDRIVSAIGRRVDAASPLVDARLPDGSRVNAVIAPIALDGASVSIRRFGKDPFHIEDLIAFGSMTEEMSTFLRSIVHARMNIVVSGGTGSGKTTLLNCLSSFIPHDERVVTIEDAAEIQLQQPHVVRLETRPANLEGKGMITCRDLVKNALRMRPDRIVVGEVRGGEALDMLQAMNTGHDGSLTTLHANSPRDCLSRLEMMILMGGIDLPVAAMRGQISSAVNFVVQQSRLRDGSRRVIKITEIVGMEGDVVSSQDIFEFIQTGVDETGKVSGYHQCTGIRPQCLEILEAAGLHFPSDFFLNRILS